MQQAWGLNDEALWEKFRFSAWVTRNTMFWEKGSSYVTDLLNLPSIDTGFIESTQSMVEMAKAKTLAFREKFKTNSPA